MDLTKLETPTDIRNRMLFYALLDAAASSKNTATGYYTWLPNGSIQIKGRNGLYAVMAFSAQTCVGIMRSKSKKPHADIKPIELLAGAPAEVINLAEEKLLAYFQEDSTADTTGLSGLWGDRKDNFHYPTSGEHEFTKSPDLIGAPFCHFKHLEHSEIYIKKQLKLKPEQEQTVTKIAKRRLFLWGEDNWDTRMHLSSEEWVTLKRGSSPQNLTNRLSSLGINPPLNAER